ncbi:MAG TPA: hypothetical protein VG841_15045 [Caulobacterales bacterium]|nr:hypothetical protein [Caulobacterales bacterium]
MQFVCNAPGGKAWFRIETEHEAETEAQLMRHSVDKFFARELAAASEAFRPRPGAVAEQNIGRKEHIARAMPIFLTLRADDGEGLATAMLPPGGKDEPRFRIIIVGPDNSDPYVAHADAIRVLGDTFGLALKREKCFPYG